MRKDLWEQVSSKGVKIMDLSSFIIKQSPKISQAAGLRDPECGYSLSPFSFLEAGCSGNHGWGFFRPRIFPRPVWRHDCNRGVSTLPQVRLMMIVLDKIKAFFKWYAEGFEHLGPKPEAKGTEKKAAEPPETKATEAPEEKMDESSSK